MFDSSVSSDVRLFESEEFGSVRVLVKDGEPWFVSADVCSCLGIGNSRQAVSYLDEDERGVINSDTPGGKQDLSVVSEAGLYSLVLRSRKPEAKSFKRWVTHEVLPSIRKTGGYTMHPEIPDDPTLLGLPDFRVPEIAARAWADEREGRIKAEMERDALREEVEELKPKADFCDKVLAAPNRYPITFIAKDLGISGQALNGILERLGIQYFIGGGGGNRRHGYWAISSEWQDRGFTHSETFVAKSGRVVSQMHWTETGRAFLLTLFGCGDDSSADAVGTEDSMTPVQHRVAVLEARARANLSRLARAPALFAPPQLPSVREETAPMGETALVALGMEEA